MPPTFTLADTPIFLADAAEQDSAVHAWLTQRRPSQIFLLTDEHTHRYCLPIFLEKSGLPADLPGFAMLAGEVHKTLATAEQVWQSMLAVHLDRRALVICLGGGVVGDLGGFCAACWKRGIDFVQVPTTLLAMTDAAIGGKTGIDFQGVKNLIGAFHPPAAVFVDPIFLKTLPARELRSGFAEVIKHALIGDPFLLERLEAMPALETTTDWTEILRASIAVKVKVVEQDPLEQGPRALLNFGHTIGHALESYFLKTDESLTHGEAVAMGMICETYLRDLPLGSDRHLHRTARLIRRLFPQRSIPIAAFPELWRLMQQDKKNAAGTVRMAVPAAEQPFEMQWLTPTREAVDQSLLFLNAEA